MEYHTSMLKMMRPQGMINIIKYNEINLKIQVNSKVELYNRVRDYKSEEVTLFWINEIIKDKDVVLDIGANIGIYSLIIAKKYSNSIIYSIEPEAGNFYKLNRNISLNEVLNIIPYPIGISDKTDIAIFYVSSDELGSSCHSIDTPFSDGVAFIPKREQGLSVFSLDDFLSYPLVKFPNHMKIDVDGLETRILTSGSKSLRDPRLKSIMVEISHVMSEGTIEKRLKELSFKEVKRESWNHGNGDVSNILYTRG